MRVAILQFPGSNCDDDAMHVITRVLGEEASFVWHKESRLPTQVAPRVMFAPAGYFCPHCPTVVIDEEMIRSGITGPFTFQGVLGIAYDERPAPDFFLTWNGYDAVYFLDEDQTPQGIATMSPSPPPRLATKRHKSRERNRLAKASRRRNQRKR